MATAERQQGHEEHHWTGPDRAMIEGDRLRHHATLTCPAWFRGLAACTGRRPAGSRPGRGRTGPTRWPRPAAPERPAPAAGDRTACGWPGRAESCPCSPTASRSLTAEASIALARSTAVLHAAEATGPAGVMVAGRWVADETSAVLLPAGRSSGQATAPTNPPPTSATTTKSPVSSSQGGDGRRWRSDAGWGAEASAVGPSRWTPSSAKYCRMASSWRARASSCSGGMVPPPCVRVARSTRPNHRAPLPSFRQREPRRA